MEPVLQVALDFLELRRALELAAEAVRGGAQWLEAGTPLIKSAGLDAVRELRRAFPKHTIVADLKTMDAGRIEMEAAAKAGASVGTVLGTASESTILECIEAGRHHGLDIHVDLLNVPDPAGLARKCEEWGAHHLGIHMPIDDQMRGHSPTELLKLVRAATRLPIAVAGGLNSETVVDALEAGADILIVGGAITKAQDAEKATREILQAAATRKKIATTLFKRGTTDDDLRTILLTVSTPNISDAMHRSGELPGVNSVNPGFRRAGPAVTCRTAPGDWSKPVRAIDEARPGDMIVIDACGLTPAVWGELASHSCMNKGVAGVVIHGAIRDIDEIRRMQFPAWATHITPTAGEPRGFGELQVAINIRGVEIRPGDWIAADDSGVVRIPRAHAIETANRAMNVLEAENRLREEIGKKGTLAQVVELERWEKEIGDRHGRS
ncbi:MAG: orotidine 5'-phosphate decarboxylase [Candidatus Brocadiae bacterium]|nr:orotidine 5'-phosphate decarboxylase [Candidatus Brocadiia bacterium]